MQILFWDSNSNPDLVDLGIPGNDDSVKAIRYVLHRLARAIAGHQQTQNNKLLAQAALN